MLSYMMVMDDQSFVPSKEQLQQYPHPFELLMEIEVTESELLQVFAMPWPPKSLPYPLPALLRRSHPKLPKPMSGEMLML